MTNRFFSLLELLPTTSCQYGSSDQDRLRWRPYARPSLCLVAQGGNHRVGPDAACGCYEVAGRTDFGVRP